MTGLVCPAVLNNEGKYEGLQRLAQLRRIPLKRTSENASYAKFAEFQFHALRCIRARSRAGAALLRPLTLDAAWCLALLEQVPLQQCAKAPLAGETATAVIGSVAEVPLVSAR